MTYSVIIPTLNAGVWLPALLAALQGQGQKPCEIIVVDSSSTDATRVVARQFGCVTLTLSRDAFTHGGARNFGAGAATGDVLVFMTQDALPENSMFIENLLAPLLSGQAVASYARQIPRSDASRRERFARAFNYPETSALRTRASVVEQGVAAFFFSNVAAAVRADTFRNLGMFSDKVIMNEDMLLCAALLDAGMSVAYAAQARVIHSHDYGLMQTFRRYFDVGVFFSRQLNRPGLRTAGRGGRYAINLLRTLWMEKAWSELIPAFCEIGAKYAGFRMGRLEQLLPLHIKRVLSMHRMFWSAERSRKEEK